MHPGREDSLRLQRDAALCADISVNDTVDFSVPDHLISHSAALLYLVPLIMMLVVVIVAAQLELGDLAVAGTGFIAMLSGFAVARYLLGRGDDAALLPTIVAVHPGHESGTAEYVKLV
jgi:positive regulator of sigma E activity